MTDERDTGSSDPAGVARAGTPTAKPISTVKQARRQQLRKANAATWTNGAAQADGQ